MRFSSGFARGLNRCLNSSYRSYTAWGVGSTRRSGDDAPFGQRARSGTACADGRAASVCAVLLGDDVRVARATATTGTLSAPSCSAATSADVSGGDGSGLAHAEGGAACGGGDASVVVHAEATSGAGDGGDASVVVHAEATCGGAGGGGAAAAAAVADALALDNAEANPGGCDGAI